ncbi:putative polyketide synthase [Rhexocercosporidium sp. MPI-PUGE-AT-0058]|nr:putative polyketide synthase [Rhexocercosporidium sp. MPI-PUGE-AT-0058]
MNPLNEPVAIIGTGCRFPGQSNTSAKLWELLSQPRELSIPIPASRFNSNGFYHPDGFHHGTSNVQKSYFLSEDIRSFDSQFFNISTAEAESMDPQQRQLLEVVFEAMESANLTIEEMRGTATAVYVGLMCDDYSGLIFADMETLPTYGATGAARSILSNRISYFFDWTGPSMTIDSACSSSLVAVHQAVQTLRNGECRVAMAAGANLILSARMFVAESKLKMLSPNGRSRMWDSGGDGYARGEGIAAVMLKRLSDAIADGDHIECVIRETSVNQGGRSTGLTVPNPIAQVNLIRQTYAKAGLDLNRSEDRPQYFQAHGTGTKVGDLNEATAIHNTFFGKPDDMDKEKLFVGSIKTIIGHSEGAAGIAGMLEAALAVKHGVIPPNLHFETLNPKLEPFIHRLEVPIEAQGWPSTCGEVRRASVNSFGFGGTNAHVILENAPEIPRLAASVASPSSIVALPFAFSAASERSLGSLLFNYSQFLSNNPETDLNALAYTLLSRRSVFTHKVCFTAQSTLELQAKLDDELEHRANGTSRAISSRSTSKPKRILGIFTGQGAQWPGMGWDLISASSVGVSTLRRLEESLAGLPAGHRPSWSLEAELSATAGTSRVAEAIISQPLCTAVQIILVDLLRVAGVCFSGVVGHSSGEIGAAYAAGFISADAAIKIAYYRGFFANLAGNGVKGSMIAVGISRADGVEFCKLPQFSKRIVVAASNSSGSVTLSGDTDAVDEAKAYFEAKETFARILKVDTAYHSHHMLPCSEPYLQALRDCNIELLPRPEEACTWYSSVHEGEIMDARETLLGSYWMENMLKTVLFSQAVESSLVDNSYDLAIEVGPHPALKGPALRTIQETTRSKKPLPYIGLLGRGNIGVETFANALGSLWMNFGSKSFDAVSFNQEFHQETRASALQGLPTYPWDHERSLWYESRGSRETRSRADAPDELLGIVTSDQAEGEYKWRNYLKLNEIPWLTGHQIQGQTIFPATGYLVMALEASKKVANGKEVRLIEIKDFKILQAISINEDDSGVETLFSIMNVVSDTKREVLTADFICHACLSRDTGSLVLVSLGKIILHFGLPSATTLPSRSLTVINDLREVNIDTFYDSLGDVGYGYTGPFKGISFLEQKLDTSTGLIVDANSIASNASMMMHPGTLDSAIQTLFACLGTPGDGSLWTLHVPVTIKSIRVNPAICSTNSNNQQKEVIFDAALAESNSDMLCGDVTLYDIETRSAICQIEGIEVKPLMPATPTDDRLLFHELVWGTAEPDAALVYRKTGFSGAEMQKAETLEKICLFYLKQLLDSTSVGQKEEASWHGKRILAFAAHVVDETRAGRHASCRPEWLDNMWADVQIVADQYATDVDCRLLHVVGTKLIPFVRGETSILEHLRQDSLLDLYYQNSELLEYNRCAGLIVEQIAFRYPLIKILEIGGGTGGITRSILKHLDNKYSSYTFTDISVGFFEEAQETFKGQSRIIYEALDIERDPTTQGFVEHSYDLVIASNVLHATKTLNNTMTNVRKLLKPGGKLLVLEAVNNGAARVGFSFCGVPGWWAGAEDGRELTPLITPSQWDSLLLGNGFSGLDTITPGTDSVYQPVAVFISTAVDEKMELLQKPLALTGPKPQLDTLFLVGGKTNSTKQLIEDLKVILQPWSGNIKTLESLEDIHKLDDFSMVHVLNLTELDAPIFENLTSDRLESFKSLLNISKSFLWVTVGSKSDRPYSNMALGIGRTLVHEMPHLRLQVLDGAKVEELSADLLAEAFLRIVLAETWSNDIYAPKRMWSNEPELWLKDGRFHITRVLPDKAANNRLMSDRRRIEEDISVGDNVLEVTHTGTSYELQRSTSAAPTGGLGDVTTIRVTHSTLLAVKIESAGFLHLVLGEMVGVGMKVIALSETIGSTIVTPRNWVVPWYVPQGDETLLLTSIATDILAQYVTDMANNNRTKVLLVFEPELLLADTIVRKARYTGVKPYFITAEDSTEKSDWIKIHTFSSDRDIRSCLPRNVSAFVDFSGSTDLAERVSELLPFHARKANASTFFSHTSNYAAAASRNSVADTLSIALANSMSVIRSTRSITQTVIINAQSLANMTPLSPGVQIVDWSTGGKLPVKIQSAESMMRFKSDRTYLLIGMAGNLGRSLCRWMILHGAKHIVLTSRNPNIQQSWLDEMESLGGSVKIMAMDVSNKDSLLTTHKQITSTLPPIAGVANAAMVLSDTLLSNMSFKEMQTVLEPKVDGSRFLDELFPHSDLDFFILFGSSVDVMGNSGQAAYCAANMFMNSLVSSRQKRGLAGSLIGLGEVKGVGYAARMNRELNDIIGATLPLSEKEVHHMFAEGVLAGSPGSSRNPILYAGMDSKDPRKDPDILWYPHPKFWHYIESGDGAAATESKGATVSLKSQLAVASTMDDVLNIVTDAFTLKLRHKLQISSDTTVPSEAVLLELGIDSLVAVDLRAWFVNELGVDMPILKILGGATVIDLVTDAVARLPLTMMPAVVVEAKGEEAKSSYGVLVPNGLGGHDLVPTVSDPVPGLEVNGPVSEPKTETEVVVSKTPPHRQGHSKNLSFTSTSSGHSSSDQDTFSHSHSPALTNISSVPDHEVVVQLLKSTLDIDTRDNSNKTIQDVNPESGEEVVSPSSSDEQIFTPESENMGDSGIISVKDSDIQGNTTVVEDVKSGAELDIDEIPVAPPSPREVSPTLDIAVHQPGVLWNDSETEHINTTSCESHDTDAPNIDDAAKEFPVALDEHIITPPKNTDTNTSPHGETEQANGSTTTWVSLFQAIYATD